MGRANPPPGMTPEQGCMVGVFRHGALKGFANGVVQGMKTATDNFDRLLTEKLPRD